MLIVYLTRWSCTLFNLADSLLEFVSQNLEETATQEVGRMMEMHCRGLNNLTTVQGLWGKFAVDRRAALVARGSNAFIGWNIITVLQAEIRHTQKGTIKVTLQASALLNPNPSTRKWLAMRGCGQRSTRGLRHDFGGLAVGRGSRVQSIQV